MTEIADAPVSGALRRAFRLHHHHVLIVGGGTAGITVAARLRRAIGGAALGVIEPSAEHYYQPLWTLVGGGVVEKRITVRMEERLIPKGATWVRDAVAEFHPHDNCVVTVGGRVIGYDFLVVAPGIQLDWSAIPGLEESLGEDGVCSIWSSESVDRTWDFIREFRGGTAVFTFPSTPIKCPGAAQKIMYLADDHWRRSGARQRASVVFASAAPSIFPVERYARTLRGVLERKQIETRFRHNLVEVRPEAREAVFEQLDTGECVVFAYDLLHVAPPQSAPDVVKRSSLAGPGGWLELDKHTLQHVRWPNVFGLGDASSLPTSKTGAAVRGQAPVLVENLLAARSDVPLPARYDGYTACPLVTGYGRLVLAEFDYDLQPKETFPFDQSKERYSMYLLKKRGLPLLYWHGMMRGLAQLRRPVEAWGHTASVARRSGRSSACTSRLGAEAATRPSSSGNHCAVLQSCNRSSKSSSVSSRSRRASGQGRSTNSRAAASTAWASPSASSAERRRRRKRISTRGGMAMFTTSLRWRPPIDVSRYAAGRDSA